MPTTIEREFEEVDTQRRWQPLYLMITVVLNCKMLRMIILMPV
ncbi:PTPN2 isoform 13 [Pongo abelii]|uniref:PTPN2 isoform 10 n=1 Tax=Pongo abelii TaxID=9601 RepID=A0A2J8RSI8_PONAB|nr:PTPN2 isoform 10 [Pongo abelii]PNJ11486.1 PTPN2 isoform 13 [Pongo abelii]